MPSDAVGAEERGGHGALAPQSSAVSDNLRAALHAGMGCANPALHSLSRQEREKCEEKLGQLSASSPSYDSPIESGKRAYFDEVAAAGSSGLTLREPLPKGVAPGSAYVSFFKCSVVFGAGQKPKDTQGTVRLGKSPCFVPLQGSVFTPEASVHKR